MDPLPQYQVFGLAPLIEEAVKASLPLDHDLHARILMTILSAAVATMQVPYHDREQSKRTLDTAKIELTSKCVSP